MSRIRIGWGATLSIAALAAATLVGAACLLPAGTVAEANPPPPAQLATSSTKPPLFAASRFPPQRPAPADMILDWPRKLETEKPHPRNSTGEVEGPGTRSDEEEETVTNSGGRPRVKPEQVLAWRKQYPFRSLAGRLSYEAARAPKSSPPMTPQVEQSLHFPGGSIPGVLAANARKSSPPNTPQVEPPPSGEPVIVVMSMRGESFRLLHEEKVELFVAQSGFGSYRWPSFQERSSRFYELPEPEPIPLAKLPEGSEAGPMLALPATRAAAQAAGGVAQTMPSGEEIQSVHFWSSESFVNPESFGYVKNVENVVGFKSHAFRHKPGMPIDYARFVPLDAKPRSPQKQWELTRLELTSLLKHDTPRVYVSEHLPRMEELSSKRTRSASCTPEKT
jgi:hypothetical protein